MAVESATSTSFLSLIYRAAPSAIHPGSTASGADVDVAAVNPKLFPSIAYTDAESAEMKKWFAESHTLDTTSSDALSSLNKHLSTRTTLLGAKPSVADIALYARLAPTVEKWTAEERTGEKGYHHIVRHLDFVQNAPFFALNLPEEEKVKIDPTEVIFTPKPVDPKEEKERKKKEKAAALAAASFGGKDTATSSSAGSLAGETKELPVGQGKPAEQKSTAEKVKDKAQAVKDNVKGVIAEKTQKKEKKEKQPKQPKAPAAAAAAPLSPSNIDLRVGHILRAINHPNADSLYVSTIDCGDEPGTEHTSVDEATGKTVRTVCSGLNGLIPLAEMQDRKIIVVANLKPVTMRGIKSAAMVLAASPRLAPGAEDNHAGPVELVIPPANAAAGSRVFFEGWAEGKPEKVLNPKKKVWETIQPGFTTTENLEVAFDVKDVGALFEKDENKSKGVGRLVTEDGSVCLVPSLKGAVVR